MHIYRFCSVISKLILCTSLHTDMLISSFLCLFLFFVWLRWQYKFPSWHGSEALLNLNLYFRDRRIERRGGGGRVERKLNTLSCLVCTSFPSSRASGSHTFVNVLGRPEQPNESGDLRTNSNTAILC